MRACYRDILQTPFALSAASILPETMQTTSAQSLETAPQETRRCVAR